MRFSPLFVLPIVVLFGALSPSSAQTIDLGVATRLGEDRVVLTVNSSDSATQALAHRAFGLHGGVTVAASNAAFQIRIEPIEGSSRALLTIGSGKPYQEQLRREVSGASPRDAVLRACDLVIQATLKQPGFFAGKLAFVGKRGGVSEIYQSDLLFNEVRPLTRDRALVTGPKWSPDGSRIVYTTYFNKGFPDVFTLDLKTGRRQPIATFKGTNTGGVFSPDGRRIAMALSGTGNSEIYISDNQGRNMRRLTTNRSLEASPSWSPDGSRLVYTSDARGRPQLYTMSINGGAPSRLPTNISGYCSEPVWNPVDPSKIAFTASIAGGFQIALYDMKTRTSKQLTRGASSVEPAWLNDGRHLVFTRRDAGRTRLMLLDTESGKVSPLHQTSFGDVSSASFVY